MWVTYKITYTDGHEEFIERVETVSTQLGVLTFYGDRDIHKRQFKDIQYFEVDSVYAKR